MAALQFPNEHPLEEEEILCRYRFMLEMTNELSRSAEICAQELSKYSFGGSPSFLDGLDQVRLYFLESRKILSEQAYSLQVLLTKLPGDDMLDIARALKY